VASLQPAVRGRPPAERGRGALRAPAAVQTFRWNVSILRRPALRRPQGLGGPADLNGGRAFQVCSSLSRCGAQRGPRPTVSTLNGLYRRVRRVKRPQPAFKLTARGAARPEKIWPNGRHGQNPPGGRWITARGGELQMGTNQFKHPLFKGLVARRSLARHMPLVPCMATRRSF
jgi:hypothetical protein